MGKGGGRKVAREEGEKRWGEREGRKKGEKEREGRDVGRGTKGGREVSEVEGERAVHTTHLEEFITQSQSSISLSQSIC